MTNVSVGEFGLGSGGPLKQAATVVDCAWTGYVYLGVYVLVGFWSWALESLKGYASPARPLSDYALILSNVMIVFFNVVGVCYTIRDKPPSGVFAFLGFFIMFDVLLYSVHRWVLHSSWGFKKFHCVHHSRHEDSVCGLDLFYSHQIDCILQFLIPIDLSIWIVGLDLSSALFAACASVSMNTAAHSRTFAYDHLDHHSNQKVSYGIGIFMDKLFGTAQMPLRTFVATWGSIVLGHYLFQAMGPWIGIGPAIFMIFRTIEALCGSCTPPGLGTKQE